VALEMNVMMSRESLTVSHCSGGMTMTAAALAVLVSAPASSPPTCDLSGKWTYLRPSAFDHTTTPDWTNQVCVYTFQPAHEPARNGGAAPLGLPSQ